MAGLGAEPFGAGHGTDRRPARRLRAAAPGPGLWCNPGMRSWPSPVSLLPSPLPLLRHLPLLPARLVRRLRLSFRPRSRLSRPTLRFLLLPALALASGAASAQAVAVTDDGGAMVQLAAPARRIVSLAPNLTEMVFAVGAGERLVGVGRYSDQPEAARALPVLGDAHALNLEAISQLTPDLVLVWKSGTPQRQRDALRRLGLPLFESEIRSVEVIASTLLRLGTLTGNPQPARQAAETMRQQWSALRQAHQGRPAVRVFYQVWDAPLMTFNGQHLVSQALHACGASSGFDTQAALTPTVSREAVLAFNPQLILASESAPELDTLAAWRAFPQLAAVQLGQLQRVDDAALTRMSPRFVAAATRLCASVEQARRLLVEK